MVIKYTTAERDLLARLMRAEAVGEGNEGMLMVGNVVVNRVLANCLTFSDINTLYQAIYQANQFSGTSSPLFYASPTTHERSLANRVIKGEYYHPATNSLWFYTPGSNACRITWYNQPLAGSYKNHCFYQPKSGVCNTIH